MSDEPEVGHHPLLPGRSARGWEILAGRFVLAGAAALIMERAIWYIALFSGVDSGALSWPMLGVAAALVVTGFVMLMRRGRREREEVVAGYTTLKAHPAVDGVDHLTGAVIRPAVDFEAPRDRAGGSGMPTSEKRLDRRPITLALREARRDRLSRADPSTTEPPAAEG